MRTYVPILALVRSQLDGLAAAADAVKDALTPLFDVVLPECPRRGAPARRRVDQPETYLGALLDAVAGAFGRRPAFLDCPAGECHRTPDGRLYTAWLFDAARLRGLTLVPVTGLRRPAAHQLAVADATSADRRGVCVRLELPDFADLDALADRVHALVDRLGVAPDQVDVLVDFGRAAVDESLAVIAARGVLLPLQRVARWRSVTVATGGCGDGATATGGRALRYGDYGGMREDPRTDPCGEWRADPRGAASDTAPRAGGPNATCAGQTDEPPAYARATGWRATSRRYAGDARLVTAPLGDARPTERRAAGGRVASRAAAVTHHLTVTVEQLASPTGSG